MSKKLVEFKLGGNDIVIETGELAKQAQASVVVKMGETVILVTVCASSSKGTIKGFLPLTVESRKRAYASGGIPGGYFKRESRLTEAEVLASRAIDRTIRPCFPKNFYDEVQVLVTVLSLEPGHIADIPALLGVSAALKLSGLPFEGPVAAIRVGLSAANDFIVNPNIQQLAESKLDMMVSGRQGAVLMVEAGAKVVSEDNMLQAIMLAQNEMESAFDAINSLVAQAEVNSWNWIKPATLAENLLAEIEAELKPKLTEAYNLQDKKSRKSVLETIKSEFMQAWLARDDLGLTDNIDSSLSIAFAGCEHEFVREKMFATNTRIDGRSSTDVRPISTSVDLLPRSHGSAVFTRGETQALVTVTLGSDRDAQLLDDGDKETFMLHYNFPPFCVGEVGFMGAPKRREIGHGNLAKRSLANALVNLKESPYVIRVVSEVLESNGSSSMASVCGGSMALMSAGVKLTSPVAGVAMGLMKRGEDYIILTDILGDEDHLGDMDFKVAGTIDGITALQMDIKIDGLTEVILSKALAQARQGRLHILTEMAKTITETSTKMSPYAPRVESVQISPDKIRDVIGKGGATIRELTETFQVEIDISDDGLVKICAADTEGLSGAIERIKELTANIEVGQIYTGKVVKIMDFGAFVSIFPGKDGFLHISQISTERVNDINDYLREGQEVVVKAIELDKQGRVRVSMKAANTEVAG